MIEKILTLPDADPIPLPAPVPLLKFFLLLTFILHIIPMNILLGGSIIAVITERLGKGSKNSFHKELIKDLGQALPIVMTYTVTLGVAPLLFVQVLYGQFFYTSSILMAWPWLFVVPLLILGYYGLYVWYLKGEALGISGPWIKIGSTIFFVLVAFLYTNNMVLMLTPEKWAGMYAANKMGIHLNLDDLTIFPRYLHFLLAALAIAGLFIMVQGLLALKKGNSGYGRWAINYGSRWFIFPTLLQIIVGPLFLLSLPYSIRDSFLWQSPLTMFLLALGILSALVGLGFVFLASVGEKPGMKTFLGIGCLVLTLVFMSVVRHLLREAYISPHFQVEQLPVVLPISAFGLFVILLLVGLLVVGYMVWKVVQAGKGAAA
jgi:hypothetical protein